MSVQILLRRVGVNQIGILRVYFRRCINNYGSITHDCLNLFIQLGHDYVSLIFLSLNFYWARVKQIYVCRKKIMKLGLQIFQIITRLLLQYTCYIKKESIQESKMMKTGPNTQKHVRTLQQHIFSLQFTCAVLTIRLFSKKKSSVYHTASIYFHGLSTLFAQAYSDLQELYNQLLSIDQRQCVFDSDKCEFICFDEIQSMNKKLIIKMKKSLMKDFQQLQVQNFQLQEKQKSLLKVIEDKQRQLQEQLLVSKKSKIQSNNTKTPIYPRNMITQSSFRNIMQINWIEFFQSTSADDLKTCLSTQSNRFSSCESKHPTNFNHFQRQNQSIKYEDNKESYFDQETFLEDQQMPKPYQTNEEKKKIAQSFIYHGYGQTILKQIIKNPSISITRYNNIITTIMKITFRAIQSTARQLNEPILQLLDLEQKLRTALVNCRRWLPKEDLQIFYSFMKVSFGIGLVKISVEGTCRLYKEIKEHLQSLSAQDPVYRKNKAARKKRGVKNYK